jgi:hypothetical protein
MAATGFVRDFLLTLVLRRIQIIPGALVAWPDVGGHADRRRLLKYPDKGPDRGDGQRGRARGGQGGPGELAEESQHAII